MLKGCASRTLHGNRSEVLSICQCSCKRAADIDVLQNSATHVPRQILNLWVSNAPDAGGLRAAGL